MGVLPDKRPDNGIATANLYSAVRDLIIEADRVSNLSPGVTRCVERLRMHLKMKDEWIC